MYRVFVAVVAAVVLLFGASTVQAQCGCMPMEVTYGPAVASYTTYYPAPAVAYSPTVTYYTPQVAYYAPPVAQVAYYTPAPSYVSYYTPAVQPYVTYYGPSAVVGRSMYGTLKVYVPGHPVRNAWRAITP